MRKLNSNLGRERIHAMALHDKVWDDFREMRQSKGLTADKMLAQLMISYNNDQEKFAHRIVQSSIKSLKQNVLKQFDNTQKNLQKE